MTKTASPFALVRSARLAPNPVPPADRRPGRRGSRGLFAAALAVAAPAIMVAARAQGSGGGGGGDEKTSYDYSLTGPPGLELKADLVALTFAAPPCWYGPDANR